INGGRDINNLFRTHIEVGQSLLAGTLGNCQEQISIAQMLQSAHVPSPDVGVSEIGLLVKEGNQVIQGHHGKRRRVTTWLYGNTCIVGKALEETRDMNGIRLQSPDKMLSDRFGYPHPTNIGWLSIPASRGDCQDMDIIGANQWIKDLPQWGYGLGKTITQ